MPATMDTKAQEFNTGVALIVVLYTEAAVAVEPEVSIRPPDWSTKTSMEVKKPCHTMLVSAAAGPLKVFQGSTMVFQWAGSPGATTVLCLRPVVIKATGVEAG